MRYENMVPGIFLRRPNRFIAYVEIGGEEVICHVKNTGRCRELLVPGARVWCQHWDKPERKTKYDLIAVEKGSRLINMDSQAPNAAAKEWLQQGGLGEISEVKPERTWGDSRFDFSFQKDGRLCFLEVKGVTLEDNGIARFPDAPTERGTKHLRELTSLVEQGSSACVLFVIQMKTIRELRPNDAMDPAFGAALREAAAAGVMIRAVDCLVTPGSLVADCEVKVVL